MWERLTSRKFLFAVAAAVATTVAAANGHVAWPDAVEAWAMVAAGYAVGEGLADSHSRSEKSSDS